jgi:hypothetical protein
MSRSCRTCQGVAEAAGHAGVRLKPPPVLVRPCRTIAAPRPPARPPRTRRGMNAMAGMIPVDVYQLTGVADPRLSPDGANPSPTWSGVSTRRRNRYPEQRHLARGGRRRDPAAPVHHGGEARRPSRAGHPDGSCLAFTSDRDGEHHATLTWLRLPAARRAKLTSLDEHVTQVIWSPDGTRLAFVARVPTPRTPRRTNKRRRPRRSRVCSTSWTTSAGRRPPAAPLHGAGGRVAAPVQLTTGDFEDHSPTWSPDGEERSPSSRPATPTGTST